MVLRKPAPSNDYNSQEDVIDIINFIFSKNKKNRVDTQGIKSSKLHIAGPVPAAGYSLETGFAGIITANGSFCTNKDANISYILSSIAYTQYKQIIFPLQSNIWTKDNKYNIRTDWQYLFYPSKTYGLGGYTTLNNGYLIQYSLVRFNQTILKKFAKDLYAGIGYNLDYFWNIKQVNPPPFKINDFEKYGFSNHEFASGITFNFLYDTRINSINPERGSFMNVIYRSNPVFLGNSLFWQSLILDFRKYIKFPSNSQNILAFWNYEWFTFNSKPPYLLLPYTGGDMYGNIGRGYVIGRYRGANMCYLEGEYRFQILNNGLLGGVVFTNAQSFTEQSTNKFETIAPGCGAGIRIKFNKFSRTNAALDYGIGRNGSRGFFVNLGEVF